MSYLEEFHVVLEKEGKLANFLNLWEHYCLSATVDAEELSHILQLIKESAFAEPFGKLSESVLPLWQKIKDATIANSVLRLVVDLQTTNSPILADLSIEFLKRHYGTDAHFNEKLRLVGLRARRSFQGAISHYELLTHMEKGAFVFHTGGWGVGEVMDISLMREYVLLEFEGITALKELSFENAFKNLIPLPADHFLARRFGNPDALEEEGKRDPIGLIKLLLRDLGSQTAHEIKEALCGLVIPEEEWTKWWGGVRTKMKKDTEIAAPEQAKGAFSLLMEPLQHTTHFQDLLHKAENVDALIGIVYHFFKDFPEELKNLPFKESIRPLLLQGLQEATVSPTQALSRALQVSYLLEDLFPQEAPLSPSHIRKSESLPELLDSIEILAFKKRTLMLVREHREDWRPLFLQLFLTIRQNSLRDYLFKILEAEPTTRELLKEKLRELLEKMTLFPEAFFWYFQKITQNEPVPYNDTAHGYLFLEAAVILLHFVESKPEYKELAKKIHQLLIGNRYAVVRKLIEGAEVLYLKEFLLLASKCHHFTQQDIRILHSLAEVVQPTLGKRKEGQKPQQEILWTTAEGYEKLQQRIRELSTVETLDNAREIKAARALGDLRENAEYKSALERRSRIQGELSSLVQQINKARVLTPHDIATDRVGVGTCVELVDGKGKKTTYTLLGPWDADTTRAILSFQSKFAQAMTGCKEGDSFEFQEERYTITSIRSYLDVPK